MAKSLWNSIVPLCMCVIVYAWIRGRGFATLSELCGIVPEAAHSYYDLYNYFVSTSPLSVCAQSSWIRALMITSLL